MLIIGNGAEFHRGFIRVRTIHSELMDSHQPLILLVFLILAALVHAYWYCIVALTCISMIIY